MKILPTIWPLPDKFANHVDLVGPFQTSMNDLGVLNGHKKCGSEFAKILLEVKLLKSGSVKCMNSI